MHLGISHGTHTIGKNERKSPYVTRKTLKFAGGDFFRNYSRTINMEAISIGSPKLTLPTSWISESCMKIKIKITIFTLLCGTSKIFMKALKAFIKPFEAPQRSAEIKI